MGLFKRKNRNPDDLQPEDTINPDPPKEKVKWSKRPASESRTDGIKRAPGMTEWRGVGVGLVPVFLLTQHQTRRSSSSVSRHGSLS